MLLVSSCAPAETPRPTDVHHLPLRTLGGDRTDLATLAGDRAVVVALFGSWCEGCRRETPALARLAASGRASRDFVVVGVAIGEERDRVEAFAGTHSVRYPLLLDAEGAFARLGRRQVPTTFVLARDGRVVHEGAALDEEALAALARTLR